MTASFCPDRDFVRIADVCTALAVPEDDRVLFWRWADELPDARAVEEMNSYVDVLIAQRCRQPGSDLVSRFIADDLTAGEISERVAALVVGSDRSARGSDGHACQLARGATLHQ